MENNEFNFVIPLLKNQNKVKSNNKSINSIKTNILIFIFFIILIFIKIYCYLYYIV